jgi:hypothetical protein
MVDLSGVNKNNKRQAAGLHKGKKITVTFLGGRNYQLEGQIDLAKLKKPETRIVYWLPAKFKTDGLPYEFEFTLGIVKPKNYPKHGAEFKITECTRIDKCPDGFTNSDIPIYLLRSLAIRASTVVALCTPVGYKDINGAEYLTQINLIEPATPSGQTLKDFLGTLEGELLYKEIGRIWRNSAHGTIEKNIASEFGFTTFWANKHIKKGKEQYPQYFKKPKATATKKAKGKK